MDTTKIKRDADHYADAVARLKVSKRYRDELLVEMGHNHGVLWARAAAEYDELRELAKVVEQLGPTFYDNLEWQGIDPCEAIYIVIRPVEKTYYPEMRAHSVAFWADVCGIKNERTLADTQFAKAFIEGVMEVWEAVKDHLDA